MTPDIYTHNKLHLLLILLILLLVHTSVESSENHTVVITCPRNTKQAELLAVPTVSCLPHDAVPSLESHCTDTSVVSQF
jgi:hypothetical protein